MEKTFIKDLKKDDFFTLKPIPCPKESQVYVRDDYCRSCKKYYAWKFSDIGSSRLFKPDTVVYTDFIF